MEMRPCSECGRVMHMTGGRLTCECGNVISDDEPTNNELWAELAKAERQRDSVTEDLKEVLRLVLKINGCACRCGGYATKHTVETGIGICDTCAERRSFTGAMDLPHAEDMRRVAQIAKETMFKGT